MKKYFLFLILSAMIVQPAFSQTNVGGGIYNNTTWTLANSPYIVIDTIVVFPGITLTIEPGVTVKFDDHMYIEMRNATLVANGTSAGAITFTSNNPAPTPGTWGHTNYGSIYFNGSILPSINFWNMSYATIGISNAQYLPYIKNSTFTYNQIAIDAITQTPLDSCVFKYNGTAISNMSGNTSDQTVNRCILSNNYYAVEDMYKSVWNNCSIDSNYRAFGGLNGHYINNISLYDCSISYNHDGFVAYSTTGNNLLQHCVLDYNIKNAMVIRGPDSIMNCEIKYNGTGITGLLSLITKCVIEYDTIGILINGGIPEIYCNKICNNISYGVKMNTAFNFNVANNYWCTTDSSQIAAAIYDGYDNISYGLVTFLPLDTTCYLATGINETVTNGFNIYPNPLHDFATLKVGPEFINSELILYNAIGTKVRQQVIHDVSTEINRNELRNGLYFYRIITGKGLAVTGKIIIE